MKTKGEHRGHCQVCGRIQVSRPNGNLAKHGYVVPNGYFKGTCQGSEHEPLQISRVITDAIILAMNTSAARHEVRAIALRGGALKPERVQALTSWGAREYTYVDRKQVPVMRTWSEANGDERKAQVELDASKEESDARFARSHALYLGELATEIHGTDLIDREAEELAAETARRVKREPIVGAFRTKAAQKRELEGLSNQYSKAARVIKDRYLNDPARDDKGEAVYYAVPFDLHCWRAKHTALVLDRYPELASTVEAIEILFTNRNEIKARPVIK